MQFSNTITICRPAADVFAFLSHLENLPRWNYAICETRMTSPEPVGVGSRYVQTRRLPTRSTDMLEIIEYLPNQTLSIRGRFGLLSGTSTYLLEGFGDITRLTNTMNLITTGALSVVALVATAQVRSAVAANLVVLKEIVEGLQRRRDADDAPETRIRSL